MLARFLIAAVALLLLQPLGLGQETNAFGTAPQFLVDAEVTDSPVGPVLVAARLYFERYEQSYHIDAQRERPDLANRSQELTILQSTLLRFSVTSLEFRTVAGEKLTFDEAKARLADMPAVLLVPNEASIHPAIKAVIKPDALIVSRVRGARAPKLVTRPESR